MQNNEPSGWKNMGVLYDYMFIVNVPRKLRETYQEIGRRSFGYCRKNTNTPEELGGNKNSSYWAKTIGIGKSTFLAHIKELAKLNLITIHKGSQYRLDGGSYPDYYSINFNTTLQKKYNLFFNLSGIGTKATTKELNPENYFKDKSGRILLLKDSKGTNTKEWRKFVDSSTESIDIDAITPTVEELNEWKRRTA
jgi:hypothetical protein